MFRGSIHIWLLDEAAAGTARAAFDVHRLSKAAVTVETGGMALARVYYEGAPTPDVLVVESAAEGDALLAEVDSLAEVCDAGTQVLLLGRPNDVRLYRDLTRRGTADYLVQPVNGRQVLDAVLEIVIDPNAPPSGRVVACIGSRGGAGASTIAHNVAWLLGREFAEEVDLIDLDITFGTAGLAFNLETPQGIHTALADSDRLDEQLVERFLARYDDHLHLLTAPASLEAEERVYMDALDRLMDLLRRRASFVVLDLPHRWAPWTQQVLLDSDETVVIGTLDLPSLRDSKNLIERIRARKGEDSQVRLVLNHAGAYKRTQLSAKDFENAIGLAPAAVVPHDPVLFGTASNNGQMLGEVNRKARAVEVLRGLAVQVSGRQPRIGRKRSMLSGLFGAKRRDKAEKRKAK